MSKKADLEAQARKELDSILEAIKSPGVREKWNEIIPLITKHHLGAGELMQSEVDSIKSKDLKAKGANTVIFVEGKAACFKALGMVGMTKFLEDMGDDAANELLSKGKVTAGAYRALTAVYWKLLIKELSDEVFHEDGDFAAGSFEELSRVVMGKKKATSY
jgi:hypothetical protein